MRRLAIVIPLLALAGCEGLVRISAIQSCTEFYENSQDQEVDEETMRTVCGCAVDRELAERTPAVTIPDAPDAELPEYRRHIPDCLVESGASAYGIAARESAGPKPRNAVFDPATGEVEPPPPPPPAPGGMGAAPPDGSKPPPASLELEADRVFQEAMEAANQAQRDVDNAVAEIEGR